MQKLEDQEEIDQYILEWRRLEKDFFKLETLQTYEPGSIQKVYYEGNLQKARSLIRKSLLSDPAMPYKKIKEQGIKFRRVHIIQLPLTPYLKYEMESYKISTELGEEIRIILKEDIANLEIPIKLQDFLMFDEKKVVLHFYNNEGHWQSGGLLEDPNEVVPYIQAKKILLSNSMPLESFRKQLYLER